MASKGDGSAESKVETQSTIGQSVTDRVQDIIASTEKDVQNQLKQIERDFRRHIQTCIDTCKSMERLAVNAGKESEAARYSLQARIYQQILDNYSLSNSYDRR